MKKPNLYRIELSYDDNGKRAVGTIQGYWDTEEEAVAYANTEGVALCPYANATVDRVLMLEQDVEVTWRNP
jgi:hypothetical protein